jgi:Domain of unknown function (DUF5103)
MRMFKNIFTVLAVLLFCTKGLAQIPDKIYAPTIQSVQLYMAGNQQAYPIMRLNSGDQMELHFDDLDGYIKNISYTWQLCNADWTPALLSQFDFIKGFSQQRLTNYRVSSLAFTRYVHYQALLPQANCMPSRSGNYLLKVFLNGDTSNLLFTRRVLVYHEKVTIPAQIQQPFNGQYFYTHQKVYFKIDTKKLDALNALQQIKVAILQNNRWDNAVTDIKPTFIRQNELEYNAEQDCLFPGGKEWRWLDLRSLRLQSDRVASADYSNKKTAVFLKPDVDRSQQRFAFFRDNNGMLYYQTLESINYLWQADYARVHFSYQPPGSIAFANDDVYVFGALSNYALNDSAKMIFNESKGVYQTSLMLKQGYYDYSYITVNKNDLKHLTAFNKTEGNYWDTENTYTILVYYRPMGARADELVGITKINSLAGRPGLNF